ncbi:hypothetical protein [Vibrio owensii]|uniref:hypothetical protein n=1 Tax=Vibrio owensii TaxID=696485 RepID=UPI004067EC10
MPLKVALFVAHPTAIPTMQILATKGQLAGVVLASQADPYLQQLHSWLQKQQLPCHYLKFGEEKETAAQLKRWEADMALAFGFSGEVPPVLSDATELGYYNLLLADPIRFNGPVPLYWQIRQGESQGKVVLMRASKSADGADIAASIDYRIDPLDTYKLLENKVAGKAAKCVEAFVEAVINEGQLPLLQNCSACAEDGLVPDNALLQVEFDTMSTKQIVDMARAGNPVFNGCVIQIGQTLLSLLQATKVDFPTHGVKPGTICHSGAPDGLIVATCDGAIRLDVMANIDGVFSGDAFSERFQISAGMAFEIMPAK